KLGRDKDADLVVPIGILPDREGLVSPQVQNSVVSSPHILQTAIILSILHDILRVLIRRKTVLFVVLLILIVGGSMFLVKFSLFATGPTIAPPLITATAAAHAYDAGTTKSGVMFGFDAAHTHWNPYEKVLNRTNVSDLGPQWSYG